MDKLPNWPPRDWRSLIAVLASVGGGLVSFILAWRVMTILTDPRWYSIPGLTNVQRLKIAITQLAVMKTMATGTLILMGVSMLGLWFVLGKRSFELEAWKLKMKAGGGEDDPSATPPATAVVTTTTTTVPAAPTAPVVASPISTDQ